MARGQDPILLVVPGLDNSGPDHWQSLLQERRADCRRAELGCWSDPDPLLWIERLDAAVAAADAPVILVAHSLGCVAVAHWATRFSGGATAKVAGALLVAPPDVDDPDILPVVRRFAPAPRTRLPFRSLLVASRNDPYAAFEASRALAESWGSGFLDAGECGHINASSGVGDWPLGKTLLAKLTESAAG